MGQPVRPHCLALVCAGGARGGGEVGGGGRTDGGRDEVIGRRAGHGRVGRGVVVRLAGVADAVGGVARQHLDVVLARRGAVGEEAPARAWGDGVLRRDDALS